MSKIKVDIDATGITSSGIADWGNLRHNVFNWTVGQMRRGKKTGKVWSDDRKIRAHSE